MSNYKNIINNNNYQFLIRSNDVIFGTGYGINYLHQLNIDINGNIYVKESMSNYRDYNLPSENFGKNYLFSIIDNRKIPDSFIDLIKYLLPKENQHNFDCKKLVDYFFEMIKQLKKAIMIEKEKESVIIKQLNKIIKELEIENLKIKEEIDIEKELDIEKLKIETEKLKIETEKLKIEKEKLEIDKEEIEIEKVKILELQVELIHTKKELDIEKENILQQINKTYFFL